MKHRTCGAFLFNNDTYCMYIMENTELKTLGQTIRLKRENLGLTQNEVAERAGLDRNYIGMVERGERNPSYLSLIKIAKGLNLTVHQLIKP